MGYLGGKAGTDVYQTIINRMPPHRVYMEPFLGSGAVMRHKKPASLNIGIDRDREAVKARFRSGSYPHLVEPFAGGNNGKDRPLSS